MMGWPVKVFLRTFAERRGHGNHHMKDRKSTQAEGTAKEHPVLQGQRKVSMAERD